MTTKKKNLYFFSYQDAIKDTETLEEFKKKKLRKKKKKKSLTYKIEPTLMNRFTLPFPRTQTRMEDSMDMYFQPSAKGSNNTGYHFSYKTSDTTWRGMGDTLTFIFNLSVQCTLMLRNLTKPPKLGGKKMYKGGEKKWCRIPVDRSQSHERMSKSNYLPKTQIKPIIEDMIQYQISLESIGAFSKKKIKKKKISSLSKSIFSSQFITTLTLSTLTRIPYTELHSEIQPLGFQIHEGFERLGIHKRK